MKYFTTFIVLIAIPLVFLTAESPASTIRILPHIILEGDDGSYANGKRWDSSVLQGKITLLVYFDPDERDKGKIFMPTLEAFERDLDFSQFQTILIVNLKAPEVQQIELNVGVKDDAAIEELRATTRALAQQQRELLLTGSVNAREIAHSKILKDDDIIEGEVI